MIAIAALVAAMIMVVRLVAIVVMVALAAIAISTILIAVVAVRVARIVSAPVTDGATTVLVAGVWLLPVALILGLLDLSLTISVRIVLRVRDCTDPRRSGGKRCGGYDAGNFHDLLLGRVVGLNYHNAWKSCSS